MWVFTPIGFFSVVQKTRGTPGLCVRARAAEDLDTLREVYLPELTPTTTSLATDYAYRGLCTHEQWAEALAAMARDITYSNFKDEVEKTQGRERHDLYSRVWGVMLGLQHRPQPREYTWPLLNDEDADVMDRYDLMRRLREMGVPDEEVQLYSYGPHGDDISDVLEEAVARQRRKPSRRKKGKGKK